jgi:transcriptional regulator with XRE-family HTH domain
VIELTRQRLAMDLSKLKLSFRSRVANSTIGQIEAKRFVPYRPQLERLAEALDWKGDPSDLLREVVETETPSDIHT